MKAARQGRNRSLIERRQRAAAADLAVVLWKQRRDEMARSRFGLAGVTLTPRPEKGEWPGT